MRLDETAIKVKGQGSYLYRAFNKTGQTSAFLFTEAHDEPAAKRFLTKTIRRHSVLEGIPHRQEEGVAKVLIMV